MSRFNFGAKTGVDLPGEEYGLIIKKDLVTDIDLATNSFGQNLNVTMVQEVAAFSSLINGGSYYQPHLVKEIKSAGGETLLENESVLVRKTVSEETSQTLRGYLKMLWIMVQAVILRLRATVSGERQEQPRSSQETSSIM